MACIYFGEDIRGLPRRDSEARQNHWSADECARRNPRADSVTMSVPRLRMFAGPNGSGKSTIKSVVPSELFGVYLKRDEIEKQI